MGTIYPDGMAFPPYWQGQDGDVYGDNSSFQYGTQLQPETVVGDGAQFIGDNCDDCDPYIHVSGPIVIGPGATFYYTMFQGNDDIVIEDDYIDAGENEWNGAPVDGPATTIGDAISVSSDCCSQSATSQGETDPPRPYSKLGNCPPCDVKK